MHYCIGDVHGCYDELVALVNIIEERDKDAKIIFLGDFPDRGPKVWETLSWMLDHVFSDARYQSIQGNHEQMILQWYVKWIDWYKKQPLSSRVLGLSGPDEPRTNYDFYEVAKAHHALKPYTINKLMAAFIAMPFHITVEVPGKNGPVIYDIAHAWYTPSYPEDSYDQQMVNLWARKCDGNYENDHIIIHGHTPTITEAYAYDPDTAPGMIAYRKNAINIDGGCVYRHLAPNFPCMLCAICLETLEEIYPMSLEERMGEEKAARYRATFLNSTSPFRQQMLSLLP
ncbi:MAG: metallophosphoesterase [Lachnospiraceae bacterium]|nr:metallophosphoesterase [Lachnospiraceae bacterium]